MMTAICLIGAFVWGFLCGYGCVWESNPPPPPVFPPTPMPAQEPPKKVPRTLAQLWEPRRKRLNELYKSLEDQKEDV